MADFNTAIIKTLKNEGGFADRRSTTGEVVNMGMTAATLRGLHLMPNPGNGPITDEEVAYVRGLTADTVTPIYKKEYWDSNHLSDLRDQALADKVFDTRVNAWGAAGKAFQRAINKLTWPDKPLVEDRAIGPKTIAAANSVNPIMLLEAFRLEMEGAYRRMESPVLAQYLDRLARA